MKKRTSVSKKTKRPVQRNVSKKKKVVKPKVKATARVKMKAKAIVKPKTKVRVPRKVSRTTTNANVQRLAITEPTRRSSVPLVVEPHPRDYTGLPFLTLIQYRKQPMLVIVDNADEETIKTFVLDLCGPEEVDEELIILTAAEWYQNNRSKFPISIEFSRRGMTNQTARIYRSLNVDFVSRVIGPVPKFPMSTIKSVKRRRRKAIPVGMDVEVHKEGNIILMEQFIAS